jgi:peptidoglycan L-alanyl-D-glutamate endopeptidase CwlK
MASRKLEDLLPQTRLSVATLIGECEKAGIPLKITCTYRSFAEQNDLYAKGRAKPGRIVTKVRGGSSFHNCRRAVDFAILNSDLKLDWDYMDSRECAPFWEQFGKLVRVSGLDWGGDWHSIVDKPHVEDTFCAACRAKFRADHFLESGECRKGEPT